MKTFAELKKRLQIGVKVQRLERFGVKDDNHKVATITKVQTNAVVLDYGEGQKRASWLAFPSASLVGYDGDTFTFYGPGERPLTEEEQKIYDNCPRLPQEEAEREMLSDGNREYYMRRRYFYNDNPKFRYLAGHEKALGKKLKIYPSSREAGVIADDSIKGNPELVYKILAE